MRLARVLGNLWATRRNPATQALTFKIIQPEDAAGVATEPPLVAVDTVSAAEGERVFYVTAREAVLPLPVPEAPVDATIVGIVEGIEYRAP